MGFQPDSPVDMAIAIRLEEPRDFGEVESVIREAFWNLYVPGCNEHYLMHRMRNHPDFLPELSLVAAHGHRIVGQIAYTRSLLKSEGESILPSITFGPVSVSPEYQGRGIGSRLITQSMSLAKQLGHAVIVIGGHPHHYCKHGFNNGKDLGISDADGRYPLGLLAITLVPNVLEARTWRYAESPVYAIDDAAADEFDKSFVPKPKAFQPSQTEFSIAIRAFLD